MIKELYVKNFVRNVWRSRTAAGSIALLLVLTSMDGISAATSRSNVNLRKLQSVASALEKKSAGTRTVAEKKELYDAFNAVYSPSGPTFGERATRVNQTKALNELKKAGYTPESLGDEVRGVGVPGAESGAPAAPEDVFEGVVSTFNEPPGYFRDEPLVRIPSKKTSAAVYYDRVTSVDAEDVGSLMSELDKVEPKSISTALKSLLAARKNLRTGAVIGLMGASVSRSSEEYPLYSKIRMYNNMLYDASKRTPEQLKKMLEDNNVKNILSDSDQLFLVTKTADTSKLEDLTKTISALVDKVAGLDRTVEGLGALNTWVAAAKILGDAYGKMAGHDRDLLAGLNRVREQIEDVIIKITPEPTERLEGGGGKKTKPAMPTRRPPARPDAPGLGTNPETILLPDMPKPTTPPTGPKPTGGAAKYTAAEMNKFADDLDEYAISGGDASVVENARKALAVYEKQSDKVVGVVNRLTESIKGVS